MSEGRADGWRRRPVDGRERRHGGMVQQKMQSRPPGRAARGAYMFA